MDNRAWLAFSIFYFLLSLFAVSPARAAIPVQQVGISATQVILAYTAPDNNACRIEVSESSTYLPLAHDVDPSLFAGSDTDAARQGNLISGQTRILVLGKRAAEKAADGLVYSRSLQCNTKHYYRLTCGGASSEGTFTTSNIPLGNTYSDIPQIDRDHPGQHLNPTIPDQRGITINDPHTGALLKRATFNESNTSAYMNWGGFVRNCSNQVVGPDNGFICAFPAGNGSFGVIYYIIPATGETRYLGGISAPTSGATWVVYPQLSNVDAKEFLVSISDSMGHVGLWRGVYTGDFSAAQGAFAPLDWQNLTPSPYSVTEQMKAFRPDFDPALFGCSVSVRSPYSLLICGRGIQDSYGWLGVMDMGAREACNGSNPSRCPHMVAASKTFDTPKLRWCGLHNIQLMSDLPLVNMCLHGLTSTGIGLGVFSSQLTAPIDAVQTTFSMSGEPTSPSEGYLQDANVGDLFLFNNPAEYVRVTRKNSATSWELERNWGGSTQSPGVPHPAGSPLMAICNASGNGGWSQTYWKFLEDPSGTETPPSNSTVVEDPYWPPGGHDDWGHENYRITEQPKFVPGAIMDNLATPAIYAVTDSPRFAGALGVGYGNTYAKHPSFHQVDAVQEPWVLDEWPFDGSNIFSENPGAMLISGQLYKYTPYNEFLLNRKQLATIAASGGEALVDISAPGSFLSDTPADSYKYCIALAAGECRPGSSAGDIFANAPNVRFLYCTGGDGPNAANKDLCIGNMVMFGQAVNQTGLLPNRVGLAPSAPSSLYGAGYSRVLTRGLGGIKAIQQLAKSLPDASWAMFVNPSGTQGVSLVKLPPFQTAHDGLDRSTFIPISIPITAPGALAGVTNAVVAFGYAEQGDPSHFYCTSRREACLAVSSGAVDPANPFNYAIAESTAGVPCTSSCSVTLPLLPQHVAYYQVIYRDAGNNEVGRSVMGAVAELTAALPPLPLPVTIVSIQVSGDLTSATLTWKTNVPSDSQVDYGLTSNYSNTTAFDPALVTTHTQRVAGLVPNTRYHFRADSRDASHNLAVSGDLTFTTKGNPLPIPVLNLPAFLPLNATITAQVPAGSPVDHFVWTFTPSSANTSQATGIRLASGAPAATLSTKSSSASLSQAALVLGTYVITVQAADAANQLSVPASATVTLVLADLSSVRVYPNPWRSDKHAAHSSIMFSGLTVGTTIKIFTVSGHLAKELHTDGPSIPWDLTNDSGDKVASGIYMYLITDRQGDKVRGKIGIIK